MQKQIPCSHVFDIISRGIKGVPGIRKLCGKCGYAQTKTAFEWKIHDLFGLKK